MVLGMIVMETHRLLLRVFTCCPIVLFTTHHSPRSRGALACERDNLRRKAKFNSAFVSGVLVGDGKSISTLLCHKLENR